MEFIEWDYFTFSFAETSQWFGSILDEVSKGECFIYLSEIVILVKKCPNGWMGLIKLRDRCFPITTMMLDSVCVPKSDVLDFLSEKLSFCYLWKICVRDIIFDFLSKLSCKQ